MAAGCDGDGGKCFVYHFKIAKSFIRVFGMARSFAILMLQTMLKTPLKGLDILLYGCPSAQICFERLFEALLIFFPAMVAQCFKNSEIPSQELRVVRIHVVMLLKLGRRMHFRTWCLGV